MVTFRTNKCTFKTTYTITTKEGNFSKVVTFESLKEALAYKQLEELKFLN